MKHSVIYTKPLQQIDPKTKQRTTIPAGTRAEVNDEELRGARHAVRIVKPRATTTKTKTKIEVAE